MANYNPGEWLPSTPIVQREPQTRREAEALERNRLRELVGTTNLPGITEILQQPFTERAMALADHRCPVCGGALLPAGSGWSCSATHADAHYTHDEVVAAHVLAYWPTNG